MLKVCHPNIFWVIQHVFPVTHLQNLSNAGVGRFLWGHNLQETSILNLLHSDSQVLLKKKKWQQFEVNIVLFVFHQLMFDKWQTLLIGNPFCSGRSFAFSQTSSKPRIFHRGSRRPGVNPSQQRVRDEVHPGLTQRQTTIHTHIHKPTGNIESPINLIHIECLLNY